MSAPAMADLADALAASGLCVPLVFAASAQSGALATKRTAVCGWSFREVTGSAPADMQLMDGQNNTGLVIAEITLTQGQSIRDVTGDWPVLCLRGIWVQVNSGTVRGSVWQALI